MCQVSQPAWGARTAGASGVGVCLWRAIASVVVHVGEGDLPESVRHRDELSSDAPGTDSHLYPRPVAALAVCGGGVAAAERVGVVALAGIGVPSAWRSSHRPGSVEFSQDAGVVAARG